jgi:hypothetical protein
MKTAFFTSVLVCLVLLSGFQCQRRISDVGEDRETSQRKEDCIKGKLMIKGICMNYTISVISGNIDQSLIEKSWTDKSTGKVYQNVFALGSQCSFPADIKEGDDFYFKILSKNDPDCAVCMAYYPTPGKKLAIAVLKSGCTTE